MQPSIICLGSPMIDVSITVNQDFLSDNGIRADFAYDAGDLQTLLAAIDINGKSTSIGGSVTNTARIIQWLGQGIIHVTYLGAIGNDEYGHRILDQLRQEGIRTRFAVKDEKTAVCFVLLHNDKRTLCTDMAASRLFTIEDFFASELCNLAEAFVYFSVCDSFFLRVSTDCVEYLLNNNDNLIFNLGAEFVLEQYSNDVERIVEKARILIGNMQEVLFLCKLLNKTLTGLETVDEVLETSFAKWTKPKNQLLVITNGEHPAVILTSRNASLKKYPVPTTIVKDTNCAGDAFAGGFITKYLQCWHGLHNVQKVPNAAHSSTAFVDDVRRQTKSNRKIATNQATLQTEINELNEEMSTEEEWQCDGVNEVDLDECMKCALWTASEIVQNTGCNFNRDKSFT